MPEIHSMISSMETYAPPLIFQNSMPIEYVQLRGESLVPSSFGPQPKEDFYKTIIIQL